jgi:hypothetical protein
MDPLQIPPTVIASTLLLLLLTIVIILLNKYQSKFNKKIKTEPNDLKELPQTVDIILFDLTHSSTLCSASSAPPPPPP